MGQVMSSIIQRLQSLYRNLKGGEETPIVRDDHDHDHHLLNPLILPLQQQPESRHICVVVDPQADKSLSISGSITGRTTIDGTTANVREVVDHDDKVLAVVQEKLQKRKQKVSKAKSVALDTLVGSVRKIGLYSSSQMILLVGEGDFSFSASLAVAFGLASNMVATSLNNKEFLLKNYGKFCTNNNELLTRGCTVLHGIDATQMATHPQLFSKKFDRIVFNFPHSGFRSKETPNLEQGRHQKLVSGFLRNAKELINEDGQIHITHKSTALFVKWNIPKLAYDQGLKLIQEVKFKRSKYPGYHTKYGFGGDKDFHCDPSITYKFKLASHSHST